MGAPRLSFKLTCPSSVTEKSGVKSKIKPPPAPVTRILTVHDFDEIALVRAAFVSLPDITRLLTRLQDQTKDVLVTFTVRVNHLQQFPFFC